MSYCRWSSDDFRCDIYAYEHVGGYYQIHVASGRYRGNVPTTPPVPKPTNKAAFKEWQAAKNRQRDYLDGCGIEEIGLEYDGQDFACDTLDGFYEKMKMLKEIGYNVPDYTLERIQNEIEAKNT